jgi:hypothetical protein
LKYLFNLLALLLLLSFSANAAFIYVKKSATGSNNGTSWTNAYTDLQNALDAAGVYDHIWVAAGTYLPTASPDGTTTDNRNKAFHLHTEMKIYGGFAGTETQLSERDAATNITILSGDLDGDDIVTGSGSTLSITDNTENAYHVMLTADLTAASFIDGFTIKGGNADGGFSTISYQSKSFYRNDGGGMSNNSSSPTITNSTFANNNAVDGGGMSNFYSSSPIITNSTFANNNATYYGGGMQNNSSSPTITNSTFANNNALYGGGMYNYNSSLPTITNTIIWDNGSSEVSNGNNSTPIFKNSIIKDSGGSGSWNAYGADNGNNLDTDPLFVDAANGDYTLQGCSPAIDAGDNTAWTTTTLSTDIAGKTRPYNSTVDMGAYEYQGIPIVISVSAPTVTQPTCGVPSGTIVVNATTTSGTLEYSVDNGNSYQADSSFSSLSPGNYILKVRAQGSSCAETYASNPVVINALPTLAISAPTVTQPTCGVPSGEIVVNATTTSGTLEYSVDNGSTYQASNTFSGLSGGSYTIKVQ